MFSLEGKRALITGGAGGIGFAVAKRYRDAGAEVCIADIVDGAAAAREIGACYLPLDVADEPAVRRVLNEAQATLGVLDILVNNAGIVADENFYEIDRGTPENLERIFSVNTFGVFHGLKHGPAHMADGGSIINTSSLASTMGLPGNSQYSGTKAAVDQISRIAAIELGGRGIRVNTVCPAFIDTRMGGSDIGRSLARSLTALGRIGEVEDLVGLYHFLAADESRYITGQCLNVDGGWTAGVSTRLMRDLTDG
ncbi:MAG: SDR family oxidoreductase [Rhodospirillaceae bacterium]|nr:SDR family oxidoreductase [Rhodospirillaceae bacterium]